MENQQDKFKIYGKWFWIGITIGFLNILGGVVYGIALAMEPEHRKEGGIIIIWSVVSFIFSLYLSAYLQSQGLLPPGFIAPPQTQ